MKDHFKRNFQAIDSSFSLLNYNYVLKEVGSRKIKDIYQLLGPLNFSLQKPPDHGLEFYDEQERREFLSKLEDARDW